MDTADTIGTIIKRLRKQKKITMTELAKKTNFSQSYLSQLERDVINPSVGALQKIALVLDVSMASFFQGEKPKNTYEEEVLIVRKDQRKGLIYPASHCRYQLLSPNLKCGIECLYITADPGGCTGPDSFVHDGEECGVVLQGIMELIVNDKKQLLYPGDSIYFKSSLPHRWTNVSDEELILVWAVSPPSF